ncbi:uncharacterized protein LAESUDRAFT_347823 [Laetiporus sulphureus 93-53]|uniref:Uncharacterized protein n=1 Tax=Laetiporus sulphureus 93-53 TaxID=1314785 RepID=A0A165GSL1_9APHY|nr:uncharacterized protein LAESUDRAFT_347823 [Laetiporus sulphureus 93-53]KZT10753.1 hypothetical protein LAESUDRAFT_347823 [Laetiporus sulphureus 93-53]
MSSVIVVPLVQAAYGRFVKVPSVDRCDTPLPFGRLALLLHLTTERSSSPLLLRGLGDLTQLTPSPDTLHACILQTLLQCPLHSLEIPQSFGNLRRNHLYALYPVLVGPSCSIAVASPVAHVLIHTIHDICPACPQLSVCLIMSCFPGV